MGAGASTPQPPPRLPKLLSVTVGDEHLATTIRLFDLPPILTPTAVEAVRIAARVRLQHTYAAGTKSPYGPAHEAAVATASADISALATRALEALNPRDYAVAMIELAIMRMAASSPPVPVEVRELGRWIFPGVGRAETEAGYRPVIGGLQEHDIHMLGEHERDLLVLLYWAEEGSLAKQPGLAVKQVGDVVAKYGDIKQLDMREEPLSETEVYIHYVISHITSLLASLLPSMPAAALSTLQAEFGTQPFRLLNVAERLVGQRRLDTASLVLVPVIERCCGGDDGGQWHGVCRRVLRDFKCTRRGREKWHVEWAEAMLARLEAERGRRRKSMESTRMGGFLQGLWTAGD